MLANPIALIGFYRFFREAEIMRQVRAVALRSERKAAENRKNDVKFTNKLQINYLTGQPRRTVLPLFGYSFPL
jgi:hypothetical protein